LICALVGLWGEDDDEDCDLEVGGDDGNETRHGPKHQDIAKKTIDLCDGDGQ